MPPWQSLPQQGQPWAAWLSEPSRYSPRPSHVLGRGVGDKWNGTSTPGVFAISNTSLSPIAYLEREGVNGAPGVAPRNLIWCSYSSRNSSNSSCLHCEDSQGRQTLSSPQLPPLTVLPSALPAPRPHLLSSWTSLLGLYNWVDTLLLMFFLSLIQRGSQGILLNFWAPLALSFLLSWVCSALWRVIQWWRKEKNNALIYQNSFVACWLLWERNLCFLTLINHLELQGFRL